LDHLVRNEIQVLANKEDEKFSLKISDIGNKVQTLTDQLLTPFSAHIIDREMFFKDVADLISMSEKKIEDKKKEEKKRVEEMSKPENVLKSFDSILITENDNKQWLLSQLPFKIITLKLLFRGSNHGWSPDNFH
jgi:hypothetical protein